MFDLSDAGGGLTSRCDSQQISCRKEGYPGWGWPEAEVHRLKLECRMRGGRMQGGSGRCAMYLAIWANEEACGGKGGRGGGSDWWEIGAVMLS